MTKKQFIEAIRKVVYDSAICGTENVLCHPPGRKPDPKLVRLAAWFNGLPEDQKKNVLDVVAFASHQTVFGFLCVLDGVRQIEDGPDKGKLTLGYEQEGAQVTLNDDDGPGLHDLFNDKTT